MEVVYENALLDALRRIQDTILKDDLAIQWDAAREFAMIEQLEGPFFCKPWFSRLREGLGERFTRLAASVDQGVEMGFYLCYGDMEYKYIVEPKDIKHLVEVANVISRISTRDVYWIHMPVPKDRTDDAYYAPLEDLKLRKETKIYLGLAHPWDSEGTWKRIQTASKVLDNFGFASECRMGRTPRD